MRRQRFDYQPRPQGFAEATAPALAVTIGHAKRGSSHERRLKDGRSTRVVRIDLSVREHVANATELTLSGTAVSVQAYAVEDIIAEKLRAPLQQVTRNRSCRQDIFDIIDPSIDPLDAPEVKERSQREWETMRLEIGAKLPEFEPTFVRVMAFYRSLPW